MSLHLYDDSYVSGLEKLRNGLMFLLGLFLGIGGFTAFYVGSYVFELKSSLNASYELIGALQSTVEEQEEALESYNAKKQRVKHLIMKANPKLSKDEAEKIARLEIKYSKLYGIPLEYGIGISLQESGYKPKAVSYTGCCLGIKQLNYAVHRTEYSLKSYSHTFDVDTNIEVGYKMLAEHKKRYGSLERALGRYYGSTIPEQNVAYAHSVMSKAKRIKRQLEV